MIDIIIFGQFIGEVERETENNGFGKDEITAEKRDLGPFFVSVDNTTEFINFISAEIRSESENFGLFDMPTDMKSISPAFSVNNSFVELCSEINSFSRIEMPK